MTNMDERRPRLSQPRQTVQVTFDSGEVLEAPVGTRLETFFQTYQELSEAAPDTQVMGAVVDGQLRELTWPVERDVSASRVTMRHSDGMRM